MGGRLIYAGSKLSLWNHYPNTCLWERCGVLEPPDVELLYDITRIYFEGQYKSSERVKFGYNRDYKKGREQVGVGLLCNAQGCPVGVEIYSGNTKDGTTVVDKIYELKWTMVSKKLSLWGPAGW